jgi:probable HAF family extracellular repeat protein
VARSSIHSGRAASVAAATGNSIAVAINNFDLTVGVTYLNGHEVPVVWIGGVPTLLPSLNPPDAYVYTVATGINDLGQIVGYERAEDGFHAVLWSPDTSVTPAVTPLSAPDRFEAADDAERARRAKFFRTVTVKEASYDGPAHGFYERDHIS